MATITVEPSALLSAALRLGELEDRVWALSSAAGRAGVSWRLAALDEELPECRVAVAGSQAGVALGRACDSLAAALAALGAALRRAAHEYEEADRAVVMPAGAGKSLGLVPR
jgi:hypothetical protein